MSRGSGTARAKTEPTRRVPLADEVGGELERLFQQSRWQGENDLVFAHPLTGGPIHAPPPRRAEGRWADTRHCFHDLRDTFGTRMAAAGVRLRTLQE